MKPVEINEWDTAEVLTTPSRITAYLEAVLEENDPALIASALGDIARAKGMTKLSRETGLSREGLYQALSKEGNPEFATVLKVLHAFGLRLHAKPV
jgi:probable addiction module antidote protein